MVNVYLHYLFICRDTSKLIGANSSGTVSKRHPISTSTDDSPKKRGRPKTEDTSTDIKSEVTEQKVQNIIKKIKEDMEKKTDGTFHFLSM